MTTTKKSSVALAFVATFALMATLAPTAQARGARKTHVRASISHSVVHSGTSSVISGRVTPKRSGHRVYLQRFYAHKWHTVASRKLPKSSRYAFTVRPKARGSYSYRVYNRKAKYYKASKSPTKHLRVQTRYSASTPTRHDIGEWQGPRTRIPTRDYRIRYTYSCVDNYAPFLSLSWHGDHYNFEYLWSEPAAGGHGRSGTYYGHAGGVAGYFEVGTQADCSWYFRVIYTSWH